MSNIWLQTSMFHKFSDKIDTNFILNILTIKMHFLRKRIILYVWFFIALL